MDTGRRSQVLRAEQLGAARQRDQRRASHRNVPVAVTGLLASVSDVEIGSTHSCARVPGAVRCWGFNDDGQLGNSTLIRSFEPVLALASP